ncbi:hypothetical protein GCM10027275_12580 [Rhabdobacter roseus]|uniref:Uncharacterized protein n=1 Tax=Rhabdobacter roseus TaxID=1655419 RepID=A0A840TI79_9BACT|nr:hypothetical protein [Rhabdobacter roseus]MBB5283174.1 hypothetical protein [Rhabdobacter roseus]
MRYLKDIPNPTYKISVYQWNGKYIIKFEAGGRYEQTYKVDETDLTSADELDQLVDEPFLQEVTERFGAMHRSLTDSLRRHEILY